MSDIDWRPSIVLFTSPGPQRILGSNIQRASFTIGLCNVGADVWLWTDNTATLNVGVHLSLTPPFVTIDKATWGVAVQGEWWAGGGAAPPVNLWLNEGITIADRKVGNNAESLTAYSDTYWGNRQSHVRVQSESPFPSNLFRFGDSVRSSFWKNRRNCRGNTDSRK